MFTTCIMQNDLAEVFELKIILLFSFMPVTRGRKIPFKNKNVLKMLFKYNICWFVPFKSRNEKKSAYKQKNVQYLLDADSTADSYMHYNIIFLFNYYNLKSYKMGI